MVRTLQLLNLSKNLNQYLIEEERYKALARDNHPEDTI